MQVSVLEESPKNRARTGCLHELFEEQAKRTPEATAVVFGEVSLSYATLNAQSNRLARFLRMSGVGPEHLVGVCLESALETVVGLLAILKAGGAYLPLDPSYPSERLAQMLQDSSVEMILTLSHLKNALPRGHQAELISLDTDSRLWEMLDEQDRDQNLDPDHPAYVIYTSGSTGQPKGVVLTHRGAVNNLQWRQDSFPLTAGDRMLQTYSYNFDPSVWAIFWPLIAGATLVLPRPGGIADSGYLVETLAREKITIAGFGPAMLQMLLANPKVAACNSLRHIFCGGEAMPPTLPARFYALLPGALHNVYGPTETTIDAACFTVPRNFSGEAVPLGAPLPGTEFLLLDSDLKLVPDGREGELYIGGVSLARGYLNRPDLTAERFLPHPFSSQQGARIYRTGDRALREPSGEFFFRGRNDSQIKLRGFRIELGEIEAALSRDLRIHDALVTLWEDHLGEARLVAYLVAKGETAPTPDDMRQRLAESLPSHMIPELIVFLEALPLTPSGKHDRQALPPPVDEWKPGVSSAPSEDPIQRQIAQIWEDLLDKRPIGFDDHFWDIGGHSLLAARMMDQVAALCGRSLPLSLIYETGTVETLVEAIRNQTPTERSPFAALSVGGKRTPFFFLHGFHPLGGFYSCHIARNLPPEQPFYAIHPPGRCREALSVEQMAADARKTVQSIQPEGPYRIGGFCGSALVAYEMAQQWKADGQEVEFLALVEVHRVNARVRLILRRLLGTSKRFLTWHRRLLPIYSVLRGLRHYWQSRGWTQERRWIYRLMEVCDFAAGAYTPLPYDGPATLLYAKDDPEKFPGNPYDLWKEIAPQLSLRAVPGDHRTCVLTDISGLADGLRACLETIGDSQPTPAPSSHEAALPLRS